MTTELWALGLAFLAALIGAFGPIYIKRGMDKFSLKPRSLTKNYNLMAGVFFYVFGILMFMFALKGGELSILYPSVATSYIWVSILSVKMLKEKMDKRKWLGIAGIILGVILIAVGF
jgi:drug/metabolite transporter (DMT)-like permease